VGNLYNFKHGGQGKVRTKLYAVYAQGKAPKARV